MDMIDALSLTHRPGTIKFRANPNTDSDCDYFTCPGCGTELYSSWVHAWAGIECEDCGCTFAAQDEEGHMWDFEELPRDTTASQAV